MVTYFTINNDLTIGKSFFLSGSVFTVDTDKRPAKNNLVIYKVDGCYIIGTYKPKNLKYLYGVITEMRKSFNDTDI